MKDLLPIGSVVTLKEGTKKLMIMRDVYGQKAIWIRSIVTYLIMRI